MTDGALSFFLVATPGLSHPLGEEARAAGFKVTRIETAGVHCAGGWNDVWRANLDLRGAIRVLVRMAEFRAMHLAQLDKRARKLPWTDWLRADIPVRVEATCRKSRIYHDKAARQRVERALEAHGFTLSADADLTVKLRIEDDLAVFSLDTSGTSLHKRGLKERVNKAPMRETMAAMFLRMAGYDGTGPVVDPMCGSGTFVLEAAEIALGRQPGRARDFAFQKFANYDAEAFQRLLRPVASGAERRFFGSDRDAGAVEMSRANATSADLTDVTVFDIAPIADATPPDGPPGLVIVNPPYGGRIGNKGALHALYGAFGTTMRSQFEGWRVALITSEAGLAKSTALPWQPPGPIVDHGGTKIRLWQAQL